VTLVRIALAGALLFGVSCVMQDEGEPGFDESVHEIGLDEMNYSSDESMPAIGWDDEATVEEAELDGVLEEEAFSEEAFGEEAWEDPAIAALLPSRHYKTSCSYCNGYGKKKKCYSSTHPHEWKAKDKAKKACEKKHKTSCWFQYCKKAY
jgi:hypothetical protein